MAIAHFAFGAAMTGLLVYLLRPGMRYSRSIALLGGIWAMIPDVQHITPVYRAELARFHDSPVVDLFWAHRFLDLADPADSPETSAVAVGFLFLVSVLLEAHSSRRLPELVVEFKSAPKTRPYLALFRRLTAVVTILAGGCMIALVLVRDTYLGLLMGTGTVLGLTGLGMLFEDPQLRYLAVRTVPVPIRTAAKLVITLLAAALVLALLSTLSVVNELHVGYGALALIICILLIRLWVPSVSAAAEPDAPAETVVTGVSGAAEAVADRYR